MTASTTRRTTPAKHRLAAVSALAVAGALVLSACGDQTEGGSGNSEKVEGSGSSLNKELPKKYQDSKVIKVGSDIAYAPMEFDQNGKAVGVDVDIANALGKELGVEFKFQSSGFDNIIPSLDSGRYDVGMSAMTDTKARQEGLDEKGKKAGKGADFVDYFNAGVSILVQKGNPKGIKSLDDLCGETVAYQRGTVSEGVVAAQNKKCDKKIETITPPKDTEALLQLKQGRAVADLNDSPVAAYNAKVSGGGKDFEVVAGEPIDAAPYGIAVAKDNTELRDAIKKALDKIMESGEYDKILKKWNVQQGALEKAAINSGNE